MALPVMKKAQKIKQIIPMTNGIFSHMNYEFRAEVTKVGMDIMFGTSYGERNPSPVVEGIQNEYGEQMGDGELNSLAALILQMYKPKWDKLGRIYDIEYDPIHNYLDEWEDTSDEERSESLEGESSRTDTFGKTVTDVLDSDVDRTLSESSQRDFDKTRTDNLSELETRNLATADTRTDNLNESTYYGKTDLRTDNLSENRTYGKTDTRTDNLSETVTYGKTDTRTDNLASTDDSTVTKTGSGTENNSIFGFNSTTAVNSDSTSTSDTNTETVDRDTTSTGTVTNVGSGSDTKANTGTSANVESGSDGKTNTGTVTNSEGGSDRKENTGTQSSSGTNTGTVTIANTGTQAELGNDDLSRSVTEGVDKDETRTITNGGSDRRAGTTSEEKTGTSNRERSGRHFGNIGNLTSQKQILEEINLWRWNYMQEILNDVKEFCTLPVYLRAGVWSLVDQPDDF